ncbi:MAG: alpha/beta fold hydrolase [Patescibacteria group bacterium]
MKVIMVHGYLGFPQNCWFPWLQKELKKKKISSMALTMPDPAFPDRYAWQETLGKAIKDPAHTILVGHSLGTATILHYLQEYNGPPFAHVILAAGFGRDFMFFAKVKHWFNEPLDFAEIKKKSKKWTSIHSTNDPLVPFKEGKWLSKKIGSDFIVENKGHLTKREGACELPSVLKAIESSL